MVSKKAIQNKLKRKRQKSQERTRQLEFKAMVDRDNAPNYIKHYSTEIPLGEERICRTGYLETRFKNGDPSVFLLDVRKFVKRKRKVKEGDDDYRPVFKQGINFRPESWNAVYMQLTDLTMELSEPDDWLSTLKNMIEATWKKYPKEFSKAFLDEKKQLTQPIAVATPENAAKNEPPIRKKPGKESSQKDWIMRNL